MGSSTAPLRNNFMTKIVTLFILLFILFIYVSTHLFHLHILVLVPIEFREDNFK